MSETNIDSFILRFVHDIPSDEDQLEINWHGLIRHVQSKESIQFSDFEAALEFINNYVSLSNKVTGKPVFSEDVENTS